MSDRPAIAASLERDLMLEAGFRCAICKTTEPLQIDHIDEWSNVKSHEFTNMIVLCANCHARKRKTSDPRHINRASLRKVKHNLMLLNGRYSDLERRLIERFQQLVAESGGVGSVNFCIHDGLALLCSYLERDGVVTMTRIIDSPISKIVANVSSDQIVVTLTPKGREFLCSLSLDTDA